MGKKILKATHEGVLKLNDTLLEVAVLEDDSRIIKQAAVFRALDRPPRGNSRMINIPVFMDAQNLQPYINEEFRAVINKVEYIDHNGKMQEGYNAMILPLVCDLYLKAREAGVIKQPNQIATAHKAEILIRSLAKVGIIALVDEATGYQHDREKDELQKILKAFISEELLPWQKRFPDIYYKELFRLNGWDYTVKDIKRRPQIIGKWTNTLIYEQLPEGVLNELRVKTPKSLKGNRIARFHQNLTEDIGHPALAAQITQIVTLFQISDNMKQMWAQFNKLKSRQSGQLELPFGFDDDGHTIVEGKKQTTIEKKDNQTKTLDQSLKKALEYNPHSVAKETFDEDEF